MKSKRLLLGIAGLLFLIGTVGSASAGFVTFDFRNLDLSGQNTATMTVAGYQLQVQAWTAQHNTGTNPWTTTQLGSSSITWTSGQGLGVSNTIAGNGELDTNLYNGNLGYQDWLSFKLLNPPTGTTKYTSITYSGMDEWLGNNVGEFSQARISTQSGGILQGGANPLGSPNSMDQLGLASDPETLALPDNFINGNWYLLAGPRLSGINNTLTGGVGDSFRVAAVTMDIPGAVVPIPAAAWLFGTGIAGLAAIRKKRRKES